MLYAWSLYVDPVYVWISSRSSSFLQQNITYDIWPNKSYRCSKHNVNWWANPLVNCQRSTLDFATQPAWEWHSTSPITPPPKWWLTAALCSSRAGCVMRQCEWICCSAGQQRQGTHSYVASWPGKMFKWKLRRGNLFLKNQMCVLYIIYILFR